MQGSCDGFPRVSLGTRPGICVGLVADRLGFPRGIAVVGDDLYVTDLGSRTPGLGRRLRLRRLGRDSPEVLLAGLDRPNGIVADGAGGLYVAEATRVVHIDSGAPAPRLVLVGLPGDGLHPLASLAILPDGALAVGVGSRTNNCEREDGRPPDAAGFCPEASARPPRGAILRFRPDLKGPPQDARAAAVLARGLRNPAALTAGPDGMLFAAANARDGIDEADPRLSDLKLPHDILVAVEPGADYGWPYCFDRLRPSPEYPRFHCGAKRPPLTLLPPHSAPLGMLLNRGDRLPGTKDKLLLALHGYRAAGHRLIALDPARPGAPPLDLVSGWTARAGVRPQGAPAALLELPDGSALILEDRNRALLRLSAER